MTDINQFNVTGNRVTFTLDDEEFTVKYPDEYNWGREVRDVMKDIALCAWANKLAFTRDKYNNICFDVTDRQLDFWLWIAQRVHLLDMYKYDEDRSHYDFSEVSVSTGGDPSTLIERGVPDQEYEGALLCQSPGKESVAAKLILEENGVGPVRSMFYEYPSRAATHKIDGREEFEAYFDNPTTRVWSDTNTLQSTLEELTDNYEPITCFWEWMYCTISVPLMVEHGLKYLVIGSQLDTGEIFEFEGSDEIAVQEPNQSYVFELAYSDYLNEVQNVPVVQTSNVRPFTGYTCRQIIADYEPGWLPHMQNCLRPKPANRWCGSCYKCCNAWVEFMACGIDPEEVGLSHDVLHENPHLGADNTEDWGFSFPRFERDEMVWQDDGAKEFFFENIKEDLTEEQLNAYFSWRTRQASRVDEDELDTLRKYQGKFVEPISAVVPDDVLNDMEREHTDYVPKRMDPREWHGLEHEWKGFKYALKQDVDF